LRGMGLRLRGLQGGVPLTWISPARFAWQRAVLVAVFVGGGVFALVAFVKAEPRWALAFLAFSPLPVALLAVLMRCRGCGRCRFAEGRDPGRVSFAEAFPPRT
jgi:hypothetical protein